VNRFALILAALVASAAAPAEPLSLEDALALAERNNPDLLAARLGPQSASVDEVESWAGVLPRLDLSSSLGRTQYGAQQRVVTAPRFDTDSGTGESALTFGQQAVEVPSEGLPGYSLGLQLQLPLFDGFRSWNTIRQGALGVEAADAELAETSSRVRFEVVRRFYELVKAERTLTVLEESVSRSEDALKQAQALFEAGRVARTEALAAEVNLGNDRMRVETQRARIEQARAELAVALGVPVSDPLAVQAPEIEAADSVLPAGLDSLVERAVTSRPLVKAYGPRRDAAALEGENAKSTYYPEVGASLSYDRSGPTFAGTHGVWGDPTRQFAASGQLYLRWNLFDGRRTSAAQQRAAINARRVDYEAERAKGEVASDVVRARAQVVALVRSLELARASVKIAELAVELSKERLLAGAAAQIEVRDASLKLTEARLSLVGTTIDLIVARADLERAVGGPLSP